MAPVSVEYSIALAVVSALIFLARLVLPQLPLKGAAVRLAAGDVALLGAGALGLAFHCTAMFYRRLFDSIPAAAPLVDAVNGMGVASVVAYVIPALLVLIGLRRQHPVALTAMAIALVAVGITMYNSGPLQVHLVAIFISVVVLVGVVSVLAKTPWQGKPQPE